MGYHERKMGGEKTDPIIEVIYSSSMKFINWLKLLQISLKMQ